LPEIVAQMEKAQDPVIRADHKGPFVISGPAGSGKTTLALHRIAYFVQSPETNKLYPHHTIIVFVPDQSTKKYFSQLLPQLSILDVKITTFVEWAFKVLELDKFRYINRIGLDETAKDLLEYAKLQAINNLDEYSFNKNIYNLLSKIYKNHLTPAQQTIFKEQRQEYMLDKVDLTILLKLKLKTEQQLLIKKTFYEELKNGKLTKKVKQVPLEYNLIVVDEFQNYLPDQLNIFRSCINSQYNSLVYVGDMSQQTQLGTIKDWQQINEKIEVSRYACLQKVYRNTKNILTYIKNLGYNITIPEQIKEGSQVQEIITHNKQEEIEYLAELIKNSQTQTIGIIAKDLEYLDQFKDKFNSHKNVFYFSIQEVQGVEFDKACLVGINQNSFSLLDASSAPQELIQEKRRINKDCLYVALTRAIHELYILGQCKLKDLNLL